MERSSRRNFMKGLLVGGGLTALGMRAVNYFKQKEESPLYHFFKANILSEDSTLENKGADKFSRYYILNDKLKMVKQSRSLEISTHYKSWGDGRIVSSPSELFEIDIWEGRFKNAGSSGGSIKRGLPDKPQTYTFVLKYPDGKTKLFKEDVDFLNNHEILNAFLKGLQMESMDELRSSYDSFSLWSKDFSHLMNIPSQWEDETDLPHHLRIRPKDHLVHYVVEGLDALTFGNKDLIINMWNGRKDADLFKKYKSDLDNIEGICLRNI